MVHLQKKDLIIGECTNIRASRYDYDSISVSHDGITIGTEGSFKESR